MKRERTFDYSRKEEIAGTTEWSSKMIREEKQVKDVCHNSDMIESNTMHLTSNQINTPSVTA